MKKYLKDFRSQLEGHHRHGSSPGEASSASSPNSPTARAELDRATIFRYRKQRGINLGSWFVLERWIAESPFQCAQAPAQSDLDVAKGKNAKEILERHWDSWITEADWDWIAQRGINSVRIPIGYYHICGADRSVLDGTDFWPFYSVYESAWSRITRAISSAHKRNIGVLFDLHAAPGKQNNDSHSGTSNPANFFNDKHNQRRGIYALEALVSNLRVFNDSFEPHLDNIIGVELLNEPQPPSDRILEDWYCDAIAAVQKISPGIPIYISECWRTDTYADFLVRAKPETLTILDHHLYRCFTSADIRTSVQDHTNALRDPNSGMAQMLNRVAEKVGRAGGGIVVGEWSGALNPGSLRGVPNERREFVQTELDLFERTCGGWFFWTYKKQVPGDQGWSFRDAVEQGVFPPSVGLKRRASVADDQEERLRRGTVLQAKRQEALDKHTMYWSKFPGGHYEHWRFGEGFEDGWNDNLKFLWSVSEESGSVSEIGFKHAWVARRSPYRGSNYWEYEHGFLQGVEAAREYFENSFC